MKVYVVLESNKYTEYDFCGVYATLEKAEIRINEIVETNGIDREESGLYVEEIDLDLN